MAELAADLAGIGALVDPVRRELYLYVCGRPDPVTREAAAAALGLPLHQAKFHLDRLVREGLLETGQARLTGRSGPGAGRPAKLYRRADRDIAVSLPERRYALAGDLLAEAVTESARTGEPVLESVSRAATSRGHRIGEACRDSAGTPRSRERARSVVMEALAEHGYEPRREGEDVVLVNCPFHALAQSRTELVCGMNLALLDGLVAEVSADRLAARLEPAEGRCCVVLGPA